MVLRFNLIFELSYLLYFPPITYIIIVTQPYFTKYENVITELPAA